VTFFGLGGFEVMVIAAIALFVLGPKRLLEGIRDGRRMYSDLKRQRDALQSMITEAIDMEDMKNQVDINGVKSAVKSLENDFKLDQAIDGERSGHSSSDKSGSPKAWQPNQKPLQIDSEMRDAIPDLNLSQSNGVESANQSLPEDLERSVEDSDSNTAKDEQDEVKS